MHEHAMDAWRLALDAWDVRHLILLLPILAAYTRFLDRRYRRRAE